MNDTKLTTGDVARELQAGQGTVLRWMTQGVTIQGQTIRLRCYRHGVWRYTTRPWLREFLDRVNGAGPALTAADAARPPEQPGPPPAGSTASG